MTGDRPPLVLYSASPRRRALLERIGIPLIPVPVDADEEIPPDRTAPAAARLIAVRKLEAGEAHHPRQASHWRLAADTLVEGPDGPMGKALDAEEAAGMIRSLSGRSHWVHSAFAVRAPDGDEPAAPVCEVHSTRVVFRRLDVSEVDAYIAAGEWRGAAGAYRIQESAELFVSRIEGLWSTVVGLPLGPLCGILSQMSYPM